MDTLDSAVLSDPSIHFVKQAAYFGRKKRRWFVLHRNSHILAYYVRPFVPPAKGEIKGIINLAEVVDVNSFGARLEIKVARGRSTFKLLADSDKIAHDWSSLIRMEAHTSGLNNPLNQNVQNACGANNKAEDPLYTEYGGFKFADQNPELYTDYEPQLTKKGKVNVAEEENYGNFTPNTKINGEEKEKPTDGQYLEQAPPPADSGYLDNQTATADADDDDDNEDNAADVSTFTPTDTSVTTKDTSVATTDTSVAAPNPFDDSATVAVVVAKSDAPNPFADDVPVATATTTTTTTTGTSGAVEVEAKVDVDVDVEIKTDDADVVVGDGGDTAGDDNKTEDSAATTEQTKDDDDKPSTEQTDDKVDDATATATATTTTPVPTPTPTTEEVEKPPQQQEGKDDNETKKKEEEVATTPTEQPTTEQPSTETTETPVNETPQAADDTATTTAEE